jgi:hypothetical protein
MRTMIVIITIALIIVCAGCQKISRPVDASNNTLSLTANTQISTPEESAKVIDNSDLVLEDGPSDINIATLPRPDPNP